MEASRTVDEVAIFSFLSSVDRNKPSIVAADAAAKVHQQQKKRKQTVNKEEKKMITESEK